MVNKPKIIEIPASEETIFKYYLQIINSVLSKERKLTGIEIDVLEKILQIDYKYRHHSKEKRDKIIFNRITKERIRAEVYNISEASFNNILMKLRNKGFITKDALKVVVPINEGKIDFLFKLSIKND